MPRRWPSARGWPTCLQLPCWWRTTEEEVDGSISLPVLQTFAATLQVEKSKGAGGGGGHLQCRRWQGIVMVTSATSGGTSGRRFNKREDDFPSSREYNDYLEEVEDMTFNLIEGINVPAIETKLAKYQEENAEQIINSRARRAEELAASLRASKRQPAQSDDSDIGAGQPSGHYAPTALPGGAFIQPRPIAGAPQPIPVGGMEALDGNATDDIETTRLKAERGARAGGWTTELSKRRAFEEAFGSLWL